MKSDFKVDIWSLQLGKRLKAVAAESGPEQSPGEKLFYGSCTLCHAAPHPSDFTYKQWKGITNSMFPRAGLNEKDRNLVLDFLQKNAKKG